VHFRLLHLIDHVYYVNVSTRMFFNETLSALYIFIGIVGNSKLVPTRSVQVVFVEHRTFMCGSAKHVYN
jgi:hypothetical protein